MGKVGRRPIGAPRGLPIAPLTLAVLVAVATAAIAVACSSGAVDSQACLNIETARCQAAPACSDIDLGQPVHNDSDVAACIRFYQVQCLHGLVTPTAPSGGQVSVCVAAIAAAGKAAAKGDAGACDTIVNPQDNLACAFLNPPDAGVPDSASDDASDDGG